MGSLGDVARGICLVSHIKNHLPDSRVSWLIEARRIDMVNFHPQLNNIIVFDRCLLYTSDAADDQGLG